MVNTSKQIIRTVDQFGNIFYTKDEKEHREDGPAVIYPDGYQVWYKEGLIHREDGPAIIRADGRREWYKDGKLHREDGPAVIYTDGRQYWYKNDFFIKTNFC